MFHTPYEAAPFSQFTAFDYLPAIQTAINDSLAEIQKISKNYKPATFENTILPLAYNDLRLERLTSMFFNLNSAATTPELPSGGRAGRQSGCGSGYAPARAAPARRAAAFQK